MNSSESDSTQYALPFWQRAYLSYLLLHSLFLNCDSHKFEEKNSMAFDPAQRQQKHREKMRARNLASVQVWVPKDRVVEIKAIAVRMIEEGSSDMAPSQRQIAFAQFLCDKKGLKLSQGLLSSSQKLSEWLNKNKKKADFK